MIRGFDEPTVSGSEIVFVFLSFVSMVVGIFALLLSFYVVGLLGVVGSGLLYALSDIETKRTQRGLLTK